MTFSVHALIAVHWLGNDLTLDLDWLSINIVYVCRCYSCRDRLMADITSLTVGVIFRC